MRTAQRTTITFALALLVSGCELFPGQDDTDFEAGDDGDTETTDDGEDPPPEQGLRVYPKFMLQDVPAIVTIEVDGMTPEACELDGAPEGGYLCDASSLPANGTATVVVEKDGFDSAVRHLQLSYGQILALDVHLASEGGPTGVWSDCQPVGQFTTCAELCGAVEGTCAVASCATSNPESPIATYESFSDAECITPAQQGAIACEDNLAFSNAALRCCCAP